MSFWSELLDFNEYVKLIAGLIAICNPLSTVPVYLAMTEGRSPSEKKQVAVVAASAVFLILVLFVFLGEALLRFFGISIEAFRIAGGLMLLLMSLSMMGSTQRTSRADEANPQDKCSVGIMPLAIPLTAGPGAMSTIIVYAHRQSGMAHDLVVSVAVAAVAVVFCMVLWFAPLVVKLVGKTGMNVFTRVMGLIIAAIAVEFIIDGLAVHFPAWVTIGQ
jgi:multiple antibiotic resistance protein